MSLCRGYGVRALEPIKKGSFLLEYAGEVIDDKELARRMDRARLDGEPHFYIMELGPGGCIHIHHGHEAFTVLAA